MQKLLFATTALVATAGMAAADVTFGGYARFGAIYTEDGTRAEVTTDAGLPDTVTETESETQIESRFRLIITATAESDAGLGFGAQVRYQSDEHRHNYTVGNVNYIDPDPADASINDGAAGFNTVRYYVTYEGLEVSVGNTQGALEFMPGMYAGSVGLTGLGYGNLVYKGADAYSSGGQGRQGFDVKYSMGPLAAHLSYSSEDFAGNGFNSGDRTAAFLSYELNDFTVTGAFQSTSGIEDEGVTKFALTANTMVGPADVTAKLASNDYSDSAGGDENEMEYGLAADFEVGAATTVTAYLNHDQAFDGFDGGNSYGVGFVHELGGGASVRGGVAGLGQDDSDETQTRADLGVRFNF